MRRMNQILMVLAVLAMTAAPAFAQHGRGGGRGHNDGHRPPARRHYDRGHYGRYVPGYKQLWLHTTPSYYHAPYTRLYRPGCYAPYYGGSVGYRSGGFGIHVRF